MASRFLNSLSSIMYVGQIFGIMPVHRRLRRRRRRKLLQGRGRLHQQCASAHTDSAAASTSVWPSAPVTLTVLNLHDERVFGEDDANGIVNITDTSDKDYVKSDKSPSVEGRTESHYVTQFNWKYPFSVYSMTIITLGLGEWLCAVRQLMKLGANLGTIGTFNFYTIANFALIIFFGLARKWSQLHAFWANVARLFDELPYRGCGINSGAKIRAVFYTWTVAALVDTLLFRISSALEIIKRKRVCNLSRSGIELIYRNWRFHIYQLIDFQLWHLPLLELVNVSLTFTWTYLDVFIMMISIGLRSLFDTFHNRLEKSHGKRMPFTYWIEIRTHYVILRNLVELVNEHISILIALSFASNLYFICLQLFNSFADHNKSWFHIIYFFNTLVMVIARTMFVLNYSSGIAIAAKRPLTTLRRIPTESWNDELQRLFNMMSHDVVALSGARFFHLTKSLFLALAGTVATYELVILDTIPPSNGTEVETGIVCSR